jgi:MFS family permease
VSTALTDTDGASTTAKTDAVALRRIILASSLGTMFEWYDFYLYGSLAGFFGGLFFPKGNDTAQLLASLATFGAGFGVRPLGAIVFGHIGDRIGRKYTFLVTLTTMGLSTAMIGLLPTYASLGLAATALLVLLRLIQGLALGGEYGGAATYVAEHVPDDERGYYTSFIQTTATLGFFLSLGVIGATRAAFGEQGFTAHGWRVPFLLSFVLLGVSLYMRVRMNESPLFSRLKASGHTSRNPLKESFTNPVNLRYVLIALFGATAGQGVVWYTGQFYALTFLQSSLKLDWKTSYTVMAIALALATPLYVFFGRLSDRLGRKRIMMLGLSLAALTYVPMFMGIAHFTNPGRLPVPDPSTGDCAMLTLLLFIQMSYGCMVYGPIAAFLVELFPTKIRYTSMSVPYHLGNGWFGGFLPLIATAVTTSAWAKQTFGANAIYAGLAYPIVVCLSTLVIGGLYIRETRGHKIDANIHVPL